MSQAAFKPGKQPEAKKSNMPWDTTTSNKGAMADYRDWRMSEEGQAMYGDGRREPQQQQEQRLRTDDRDSTDPGESMGGPRVAGESNLWAGITVLCSIVAFGGIVVVTAPSQE